MNIFNVKFQDNGTTEHVRTYKAVSAGQAFRKCLEKYPTATLIEAWKEGGYKDGWGITTYKPPSLVKVEVAEPMPQEEQLKFPFVK
jgi:hypothetical protein